MSIIFPSVCTVQAFITNPNKAFILQRARAGLPQRVQARTVNNVIPRII